MAQEITKTSIGGEKDILLAPHLAFTISAKVGNTGVSNDPTTGKKILKAGSPVGAATSVLAKRDTVLNLTLQTAAAQAQGVLRHDVDVTSGTVNAEVVITGVVDSSKCPVIHDDIKAALTHLLFVNGGKY